MHRKNLLVAVSAAALIASFNVAAHEEGEWIVRAGIGSVQPDDDNLDLGATGIIEVDTGTSLTLDFTYMYTEKWGLDVLAAWPFSHDITLNGTKVASTDQLPPTFSAQYHFSPDARFQPFVGLGVNYTIFFSTDTTGPLDGTELDLDASFGLALQLGADVELNDDWLLNFDLRYIDIESDASLDGADLGTVVIDPWVFAIAVGKRF